MNTLTDAYGISEQLADILERKGPDGVLSEMPDEWMEDLALVGSPEEVAAKMNRWLDGSVDSICIMFPDVEMERRTTVLVAEEVIPIVQAASPRGRDQDTGDLTKMSGARLVSPWTIFGFLDWNTTTVPSPESTE